MCNKDMCLFSETCTTNRRARHDDIGTTFQQMMSSRMMSKTGTWNDMMVYNVQRNKITPSWYVWPQPSVPHLPALSVGDGRQFYSRRVIRLNLLWYPPCPSPQKAPAECKPALKWDPSWFLGLAFCKVQVHFIGVLVLFLTLSLPPSLPLPCILASQFNIIIVFAFLTLASNRSPRQDCIPFGLDATCVQLALASTSRPTHFFLLR
jgi:hypothetical protein